jgi:nucleoside-diphosphate-sugar epimerase
MRVLVTGTTGFIGKNLVPALAEKYEVHALVRAASKTTGLGRVFQFDGHVPVLRKYLTDNKIDGVVHLASLFLGTHQETDVEELVKANVLLGAEVIEAAVNANVKWFLNTGTFWQHYIADSQEYHPVNLYAATKEAFVNLAQFYSETSNLKFVTLKICDTFGPNDQRNKIFNLWNKIAESGSTLDMSPGEQLIDLLYIDDVVGGFLHLIDLLNSTEKLETNYALYAKKRYSLKNLADIYQNVTMKKLNIKWGAKPYKTREVMNPWRAGTPLPHWTPNFNIEQGLNLFNLGGGKLTYFYYTLRQAA